ncbi:MAG: hypothetical protein ACHQ53_00230 [Polyangiales bacterium]
MSVQAMVDAARTALDAGDAQQALDVLAPRKHEIDRDEGLAVAWLDVLRETPARETLQIEVSRILVRWPEDPALVMRACDALIRAAERTPPDEPPAERGPAQLAAMAAAHCLAGLAPEPSNASVRAFLHMSHANALRLSHAYDEALGACERALALEPERGAFWLNLGLLHKARRDFEAGLVANQRARALLGDEKAALWNIAICATALGRGAIAVEAWRTLGHDAGIADTGMPLVDGLPPFAVRAASIGSGHGAQSKVPERSVGFEQLWVTPLSPCHGVISSASYREAAVDYGDLVLWDGVPVARAEHEGRHVPCFALLAVLRRGDERRLRFVALQQEPGQLAALGHDLPEQSQLFLHHERIELLCPRCASGEHMRKHAHAPSEEHRLAYGKIVIGASVNLGAYRRDLEMRLRRHPGVQLVMPGLFEALGETAAAGKAHQMWRGLERAH